MPLRLVLVVVLALAVPLALSAEDAARAVGTTIRGRVELRRPTPPVDARPNVSALGMPAVPPDTARRRSVVYLESAPRDAFDSRDEPRARMDQRHETFVPRVLAIVAGTTVDFPNSDVTYHNVFSFSKTRSFDLGRYAVGRTRSVRFDRPGIVRVFCDIHSHMSAYILVFAHRYFAVTDEDGAYTIADVPPGAYTVVAWRESEPLESRRLVAPEDGATLELDFPDTTMTVFSSLTNRIFFASALLAVMSIGVAMISVNRAVSRQAEDELLRGLDEAGAALEEYRQALFDHFSREARLVADLPRLKAAVALRDAPTVRPIAEEYQQQLGADLFIVTDATGQPLAQIGGASDVPPSALPGIRPVSSGAESRSFVSHGGSILQVVSVPIWIDPQQPELLGTLSVGLSLDSRAAFQFRALTNSEIAFGMNGRLHASTLPDAQWTAIVPLLSHDGITLTVPIGDQDYVAVTRPLSPGGTVATAGTVAAGDPSSVPTAILLRSRTERLRFLNTVHRALAVTALVAVLVATLLSYAIARTVTRPLGAITAVMREMAATGDLTTRVQPTRSRWEDEDARLLGATFGAMTESIARFQRDAAQKERLSSLGRLSTVVAHEIRNPLMIIKAALRGLRRGDVPPDALRDAVSNIDEEVARLDRVVTDVLDFARPIAFEFEPVDLNALCREAARASVPTGQGSTPIVWRLNGGVPTLTTDRERLRLALVNILDNARHAVSAAGGSAQGVITVETTRSGAGAAITIHDDGPGIEPDDLPRVFDPYFTTRRTGTGLGLAISRNVIEGLGGTIAVASRPGLGTDVRIVLPPDAAVTC